MLEPVYRDAGTARPLPRLIKGRTRGPVFVTHRRPGPGKVLGSRDVCPDTGPTRLSYGQARALLDAHTAVGGVPGTGGDLHEYLRSALTHLGEAGASLPMPMAKSRPRKPGNVRRCFPPSAEAIAEVTGLLAPGDSRHRPRTGAGPSRIRPPAPGDEPPALPRAGRKEGLGADAFATGPYRPRALRPAPGELGAVLHRLGEAIEVIPP